jgi:ankyrin repeat protein
MKANRLYRRHIAGLTTALLTSLVLGFVYHQGRQARLDLALTEAIRSNDTRQVIALLNQGASANAIDDEPMHFSLLRKIEDRLYHRPLLYSTAESVLLSALDSRWDPDRKVSPPLHNPALIQALLEKGADVNARNIDGDTPLLMAVADENRDVIELLLDHGARADAAANGGYTVLTNAVQCNTSLGVLDLLLDHGAKIDAQDQFGCTALICAVDGGKVAVVKTLIARHAHVNLRDSEGHTALWHAKRSGNFGSIKLLRQAGAKE